MIPIGTPFRDSVRFSGVATSISASLYVNGSLSAVTVSLGTAVSQGATAQTLQPFSVVTSTFADGDDLEVRVTGTVGGASETQSAFVTMSTKVSTRLAPATAGRTLSLDASGNAFSNLTQIANSTDLLTAFSIFLNGVGSDADSVSMMTAFYALFTNYFETGRLDANLVRIGGAALQFTAGDLTTARLAHLNADITGIAATILATPANKLVTDATGNVTVGSITTTATTALALAIQAGFIDETDGQAVLTAIVTKINATDVNLAGLSTTAIASAVRTNLATELARIDAAISSRSTFAGGAVASVTGSVGSISGETLPAGFSTLNISGGLLDTNVAKVFNQGNAAFGLMSFANDYFDTGSVQANVISINGSGTGVDDLVQLAAAWTTNGRLDANVVQVAGQTAQASAPVNFDLIGTGSGGGGGGTVDISGLLPYLTQILDQLQTDPPTQTGSQQYRSRVIVAGDAYGPGARAFTVTRHRSAEWPLDLSQWTWALMAAKDKGNDNVGTTLTGTVAVGVATGDARSLEVALSDTSTAASARHNYAVVGTSAGKAWTAELGVADVKPRPA